MRIFALETSIAKIKQPFLSQEEREIMTVHFHGFRFFLHVMRHLVFTGLFLFLVWGLLALGLPVVWVATGTFVLWFFFLFFPLLRAFVDWRYDFILVTSDKLIIVDQSSLFHQKITPLNLENFASVTAETQFWNLFPFGILHFNLKEGIVGGVEFPYIPRVHQVASAIADVITIFQRRKDLGRHPSDGQS